MNIAIILIGVILIIALIIILVTYLRYKQHINKVISGEAHSTHIKLPSPSTIALFTALIVLIIMSGASFLYISDLSLTLDNLKDNTFILSNLSDQLEDMREQTNKQNSLLDSFEFILGDIDTENNSVNVTIIVTPKTYTDKTQILITFNDKTIELRKSDDGIFTGIFKADLFTEYDKDPIVTIGDGNVNQVETIANNELGMIWQEYLPCAVETYNESEYNYNDSKLEISGGISLNAYLGLGSIEQADLVIKLNDKVFKDIDITSELKENLDSEYYIDLNEKISLKKKDTVSIYLIIKDSYGYTMTEKVSSSNDDENDALTDDTLCTITDKNGNVVYKDSAD